MALTSLLSAPPGGRRDTSPLPTAFLPRSLLVELRAQSGAADGASVWGTWGGLVTLGWSGLLPPLPQ